MTCAPDECEDIAQRLERSEGKIADDRLTSELLAELIASSDPAAFLDDDHPLSHGNLAYRLDDLLREKGLRKSEVIRASGLNETFAYQKFSCERPT